MLLDSTKICFTFLLCHISSSCSLFDLFFLFFFVLGDPSQNVSDKKKLAESEKPQNNLKNNNEKQPAAMSMSPNGSPNKSTISEPKDVNNDATKKL